MKIFFFDLDGTLLVSSRFSSSRKEEEPVKDEISPSSLNGLNRLRAMGHKVVLNTGRALGYVPKEIAELPLWDGKICGSTYVEYKGELLEHHPLSKAVLEQVVRWGEQKKVCVILEGERESFSVGGDLPSAREMLKRRELPAITKVTFCCEPTLVEQKDFPQLRVVHFKSYAEGILSGFDKSVGMKKIMELEGLKREDLWAFGDSENDRDMLLFAGNAVCMPGAPADFDHFVRYRCKKEDGVPEALEKFFFAEQGLPE